MFLRTESGPVGWRKILLAIACVIGGAAVSLSRTVGAGSLNTIWIEDAKNLLSQALNSPFGQTVKSPISGYYQVPARVITEIAVQFPLSWAPGIMSAAAALQYAVYGLVAYIASGPYLRSPWLRLLIAAPACVIPLAYTQANNDLVTVQFIGLYGAFWTLLWMPGTRAGRILSPIVMLSVASTAALAIVLAPLVVARLIVDRSKNAVFLAVFWFAGVLLQMSLTLEGKSKHYLFGFNGPLFVLKYYAGRVVPRAIFGESALGGPGANYRGDFQPLHIVNTAAHIALIGGAWAVVVVAVVLAIARFTDPNWALAIVAGLFSLAMFADAMLINTAVVQPRYVIAPALLLYTALVALLRPRRRGGDVARPRGLRLAAGGRLRGPAGGGGDPQFPGDERPHQQPAVDQRRRPRQRGLRPPGRDLLSLHARVVAGQHPLLAAALSAPPGDTAGAGSRPQPPSPTGDTLYYPPDKLD